MKKIRSTPDKEVIESIASTIALDGRLKDAEQMKAAADVAHVTYEMGFQDGIEIWSMKQLTTYVVSAIAINLMWVIAYCFAQR